MSALSDLRDRAEEHRGARALGFCTDASTSETHVALAISTPEKSYVVTIEKVEYDGLKLLELLGIPVAGSSAYERATKAKP